MILHDIELLLEELQSRTLGTRLFKFGFLSTLFTAMSKWANSEVLDYIRTKLSTNSMAMRVNINA